MSGLMQVTATHTSITQVHGQVLHQAVSEGLLKHYEVAYTGYDPAFETGLKRLGKESNNLGESNVPDCSDTDYLGDCMVVPLPKEERAISFSELRSPGCDSQPYSVNQPSVVGFRDLAAVV